MWSQLHTLDGVGTDQVWLCSVEFAAGSIASADCEYVDAGEVSVHTM